MSWRNRFDLASDIIGGTLFGLLVAAALLGCVGTVTPEKVGHTVASFDGNEQNSGFVGWAEDGRGLITAHARDRYNSLIAVYGARFAPPLKADRGITATATNTFILDDQALEDFATMNEWRQETKAPGANH